MIYLARSRLSGRIGGKGYMECPTRNKDTPSIRVLSKTTYVGHIKNLIKPHKWRRSLEFNGEKKDGDPPREFGQDQIQAQLARLPTRVKAQSNVVDILYNLELIYPPTFFDIMTHLVIHLPLEALEGGPIRPRWMFPFEIYMKKLKVIQFDGQELKKVIWYVLHNSPEIDTYQAKFDSEFPNKDMKEEFPDWFGSQIRQRHIDKDPGVSASSELFALACGPTPTRISVNSCVVNIVRFVVHSRYERRTTQNTGICSPGGKDGEMYYGQLQEILEFSYLLFKVVLFRVKWFNTSNKGRRVQHYVIRNNMTQIWAKYKKNDRCGDPNHFIGECLKPPKNTDQRAFIGGVWSDNGEVEVEKTKDEACLVAQAPDKIWLRVNLEPR
ncbi:proton-dependent oligopeptide transporter family protein [Tanacetum coccineum]